MKKIILMCISVFLFASCKKASTPSAPKEENIVFETNAGSNAISTSGTFDFQVILKSKMPTNGIRIEVTANEEATGTSVTPQASGITTTTTSTNVSVQNLPRQKWVEATVKVTSISTSTNTASSKLRVIYK